MRWDRTFHISHMCCVIRWIVPSVARGPCRCCVLAQPQAQAQLWSFAPWSVNRDGARIPQQLFVFDITYAHYEV